MADNEEQNPTSLWYKSLVEYSLPNLDDSGSTFVRPPIQANNFELKYALLYLLALNQFDGRDTGDPHRHISRFLEIYDTYMQNGDSDYAFRL